MIHTIDNGCLRVSADEQGAQLMSILTAEGMQVLWQGDPAYWGDRALNLFPYVARLYQGRYTAGGRTYSLPIHGFAPGSRFALVSRTDTRMTFELSDSEATLAQYPFRFCLRIIYALEGSRLETTFEVTNRDERTMHFGLGAHPGINVPLEAGLRFEDYRLRFAKPCAPVRVGMSADCLRNGQDSAFPLEEGGVLPLRHDLFDQDAIILRDMAREIVLESPRGARSVRVSFPDMAYLGIWHWPKTDAPYVCIEPWASLPARQGRIEALEAQEDLIRLDAGQTWRNTWTITVT